MNQELTHSAAFPCGLKQPRGGYRFSQDSLLLSAFAPPGKRVLDLGAGCGVVGLAMLSAGIKNYPDMRVVGLEPDPGLLECAEKNAEMLGLSASYQVVPGRVEDISSSAQIRAGRFDGAVMNPPFHNPGSGRIPVREDVRQARFASDETLAAFVQAAGWAVKNRGWAAAVFPVERMSGLLGLLSGAGLEPKRLVMVHSRRSAQAGVFLVEARRGAAPGLVVEPPLVLHSGRGSKTRLTRQAIAFCPLLGRRA